MSGGATGGGARAGSSGRGVSGGVDTGAATARLPNGGAGILGRLYAGTLPVHPHTDELTGGVIDYLRTQWGTDHLADPDPHPGYATDADLAGYLTPAAADALFLTQAEGDARYLPLDYVPPASGISQADADLRYVNTAGDTMTGALAVSSYLYLQGTAAADKGLAFQTGGGNRWTFSAYGAETGSNVGNDLHLFRYDDAGGYLGEALSITRATGALTSGGSPVQTEASADARYLRLAGGTLTGDLLVSKTAPTIGLKETADTFARLALFGSGLFWGPGTGAADTQLTRSAAGDLRTTASLYPTTNNARALGAPTLQWSNLRVGFVALSGDGTVSPVTAAAGAVRLRNGAVGNLAWRNAANTADLTLGVDASNALVFDGTRVPKITVASTAPSSPTTGDLWVW